MRGIALNNGDYVEQGDYYSFVNVSAPIKVKVCTLGWAGGKPTFA